MRLKIHFRVVKPGQWLPLSYQYELSAWIYRIIGSADSDFAEFLHSKGYGRGKKRFKLFTFSNLHMNCTRVELKQRGSYFFLPKSNQKARKS